MAESDPKSKPKGGGQLDLGLSSFLASATEPSNAVAGTSAPGPNLRLADEVHNAIRSLTLAPGILAVAQDKVPAQPVSLQLEASDEYTALAKRSAWRELSLMCETQMDSEPNDLEARLWWVRGQLAGSAVPVSMLTAPLDSASKELLDRSGVNSSKLSAATYGRMSELAASLLSEMGEISLREGDDLVAVTLLERGHMFGAPCKDLLLRAIGQVRTRINQSRKSAGDDELLARLSQLEKSLSPSRAEVSSVKLQKPIEAGSSTGFVASAPHGSMAVSTSHWQKKSNRGGGWGWL